MIFILLSMLGFSHAAEYGRVNASALNVRAGPNLEKQCLAPNASEMAIKEVRGSWYRVDLSSIKSCRDANVKEGWVYGSPLFQPQGLYKTAQIVKAPRGLRVRERESSDPGSKVLCHLKQGDHISVIGPSEKNPNWLRINTERMPGCKSKEAFVHRDYVEEFRDFTYVEKDPPVQEGIDPMDGLETEGATCLNCDNNKVKRSLYTEIADYLYEITTPIRDANKTMVDRYSESKEVEALLSCAQRNARSQPTGYCYRYVKNALLGGNLSDEYLNGVHAKGAGPALRRQGYTNLLQSPEWKGKINNAYDAPKGAILVYDGGQYGHIEIKVGDSSEGGFISDYYSESARTGRVRQGMSGRGRTLIGVYVKDIKEGAKNEKAFVCPRPARS